MAVEGWKECKLGDICDIKIGGTPSRSVPEYWAQDNDDGYPWASISDLKNNPVINTKEKITNAGIDKSNVKLIPRGTNLMSFKLTLGRTTKAGTDLYTNEAIAAFLPKVPFLESNFLYYILPKAANSGDQDQAVKGKTLNKAKLNNLVVDLPPLAEQKKIAEILGSVDDAIAKTKSVIDQTSRVKQGLLQQLLTSGIGHTKFKQTELGEIPDSWDFTTLSQVALGKKGLQTGPFGSQLHAFEYTDSGIAVIMPKDIIGESPDLESSAKVPEEIKERLSKHVVLSGDILFGRRGDIGRCAIISQTEEGSLCGTGCLRARVDNQIIDPMFLIKYLLLSSVQQWLLDNAVGQTMLNLNTAILGNIPLALPPISEQKKIAAIIQATDDNISASQEKLITLTTIKKGLMSDLLTGRVRVDVTQEQEDAA